MRTSVAAICAFITVSSAATAEPQPGQVIWSDIRYGMTKEQVRALHPKNQNVDLGNGCVAWLDPGYESNKVVEVALGGAGDEVGCDLNILASLKAKYGEPRTNDIDVMEPEKFGQLRRFVRLRQLGKDGKEPFDTIRTYTWFTGDTLITLKLNETLRKWDVRYQPAEVRKPVLTDKL